MSRPSKEQYYLDIAREVAQRGTCYRSRFGAIILKDDQIISTGYIGAPRGTKDCVERGYCLRDELKIPHGTQYEACRSVHAETNAIINAARAGVSLLGATMYLYSENPKNGELVDSVPCYICKKMIINAGLSKFIGNTKDGAIKIFHVEDWVNEWKLKDVLDDKHQYGKDRNEADNLPSADKVRNNSKSSMVERKEYHSGKFIVIDGIDGSGKATQTKLLVEYLRNQGYNVEKTDFPQYGIKSAGLVEEYLNGKYGPAEDVGPYRGSIFYACDRYDASFKIESWLKEGKIVISDRYTSSNVGHQGGKIKEEGEWNKWMDWLYNLEYNIFKIPKPDVTFILKTSADYSIKLSNVITDAEKQEKRNAYLGDHHNQDIHERDNSHLVNALNSYIRAAEKFPDEYKVIECLENGLLLSPEEIHAKVLKEVLKVINIS